MKTWQRTTLSIIMGILVFLLLFPFAGLDDFPTKHYSVFGTGCRPGIHFWP